ncbi:MAG: hypothetical protein ABI934_13695 [Actinomycetota bacterium]
MDRRDAPYLRLTSGKPPRRRRMFRTAKLNIGGRAAVLGLCLAGAGLGLFLGRLSGLPIALTVLVGGLLPLVLLVAADRRKWGAMLTGYGWGATEDEVSAVAAELRRRGVVVNVEVWGEDDSVSLRYRNADAKAVATVLAQQGIPPMHQWR